MHPVPHGPSSFRCLVMQVLTGFPAAAAGTWDLGKEGFPYAITMGPYGQILALCWQREAPGQPTNMVLLAAGPGEASQGDPVAALPD